MGKEQPEIQDAIITPVKGDTTITEDGDTIIEVITETLGSIPTRVIVVEELHNCGLISKKRMKKRILTIMDEMELRSVEIETIPTEETGPGA